jgi:hypothetical protein
MDWNGLMFLCWAILHETYQHGDFDTRHRLTAQKRLKLVISIAIWGAFRTVSMICLWYPWWIELIVWRIVVVLMWYRGKKLVIG